MGEEASARCSELINNNIIDKGQCEQLPTPPSVREEEIDDCLRTDSTSVQKRPFSVCWASHPGKDLLCCLQVNKRVRAIVILMLKKKQNKTVSSFMIILIFAADQLIGNSCLKTNAIFFPNLVIPD